MVDHGSSSTSEAGAGIVMTSLEGNVYEYAIKFAFPASNNESECEAAIVGLKMCIAAGAKTISLKTDSQWVSGQLRGEFEIRKVNMQKYVEKAKEVISQLEHFEVQAILRAENTKADALSKLASNIERIVVVIILKEKSIDERTVVVNTIKQQGEWFTELIEYKLMGVLSAD